VRPRGGGASFAGMDLICLAAGAGTRLGRLGAYLQKCMYPVGLRPFLEHALAQVVEGSGAGPGDRLALVVGHLGAQVRTHFGARFEGVEIRYVEQGERLGTGHALALAAAALRPTAPVVVWQADLFPTAALVGRLLRHPLPNAVTVGPGHPDEAPQLRATVEGDRATRVWCGRDPLYDVGLWKLAPGVVGRLAEERSEGGEFRVLPNLQRLVDAGTPVGAVVADAWIHLGGVLPTPEANVRDVVSRVWAESDALAARRRTAGSDSGGFGEAEPQASSAGGST